MSRAPTDIKVVSSTPGADTNTYSLFNSVTSFGGGLLPTKHAGRLDVTVKNSHAGTIKAYFSRDKGANWYQVAGDIAVPASAATDVNGPYDFLVDPYPDFKVDWVNGGSAQTTWVPTVTLVPNYHGAAT